MPFPEGTPTVTVQLDRPRQLGWTMGAMKRAKALGVLAVDWNDQTETMLAMPALVWSTLDAESRAELSLEELDEILNPRNMLEIINQITALFGESEPEAVPEGNGQPAPAKKPRAGKTST
jgi:hypothetical protein